MPKANCCTAMAWSERASGAIPSGLTCARRLTALALTSAGLCSGPASAQPAAALSATPHAPRLGQAVDAALAARAEGTVFPDGRGLPPGHGSVAEGELLYSARCLACHGALGVGGPGGRLAGGGPLAGPARVEKTIGQFWPYATTVFDYVRRAMPQNAPGSLSDAQSYALSAYLLHLNGLVAADAELDAARLPLLRMPNRDGFIVAPRSPAPVR